MTSKTASTLDIGDKCFWKGKVWEITGTHGRGRWVMYDTLGSHNVHSEAAVIAKDAVEILAHEAFKVGDKVMRGDKPDCTFKGRVTGYEPETNRVVCVSGFNTDPMEERTNRWAYKPHELALMPEEIKLVANRIYLATLATGYQETVRALQDPHSEDCLTLYAVNNGSIVTRGLRKVITADDLLRRHKIENVQFWTGGDISGKQRT